MLNADYSFEIISIVHSVPQFFMRNKSILGRVIHARGPEVSTNQAYSLFPIANLVNITEMTLSFS